MYIVEWVLENRIALNFGHSYSLQLSAKKTKKFLFFSAELSASSKTKTQKKMPNWTKICAVDTLLHITFKRNFFKKKFQIFDPNFFLEFSFFIFLKTIFNISYSILLEVCSLKFSSQSFSYFGNFPNFWPLLVFELALSSAQKKINFCDFLSESYKE